MTNYFVATTGSSGNSGLAIGSEKQTIAQATALMSTSDRLFIRGGTYAETITSIPSGTAGLPTTIQAYQDEPVILQPASGANVINVDSGSYKSFQGLVLDAINMTETAVQIAHSGAATVGDPHHCTFVRCELKNGNTSGMIIGPDAYFNEVHNCLVHDNGRAGFYLYHGIYISGQSNLVDNCNISTNVGYGIHCYNEYTSPHNSLASNNIVSNSTFASNGSTGGGFVSGILVSQGDANFIYNNICHDNNYAGIRVWDGSTNAKIYNNTCYQNGSLPGSTEGYGIRIEPAVPSTTVANNICRQNLTSDYLDSGSGTTSTTNFTASIAQFVNVSQNNYHLLSTSPAIAFATQSNSLFTTDKDGATRGSTWDAGAYQYAPGGERLHPLMLRG